MYHKPMFSCFLGDGLLTRGLLGSLCCQLWNPLWVCRAVSRAKAWSLTWGQCPALLHTGLGSGPGQLLHSFWSLSFPISKVVTLCVGILRQEDGIRALLQLEKGDEASPSTQQTLAAVCVSVQVIPALSGTILFALGSLTLCGGEQQGTH